MLVFSICEFIQLILSVLKSAKIRETQVTPAHDLPRSSEVVLGLPLPFGGRSPPLNLGAGI